MKTIEMTIECPDCKGTGVYQGMGESEGAAVVCFKCKGTGAYEYKYSYKEFTERNKRTDIERVYLDGYGYKIALGKIPFSGVGEIDMDKEGVSYQEFIDGKMPEHIRTLSCPLRADQSACHDIPGFVDKCTDLNGGWIGTITTCKHQCKKTECWERFYGERADG